MSRTDLIKMAAIPCAFVFTTVWVFTAPQGILGASGVTEREASITYAGCREAWAAGAAPLHRGEPGYRPVMDGDGDGIACEPRRY